MYVFVYRNPYGRVDSGGPQPDAVQPRLQPAPHHGHKRHPPLWHHRRVQHPVRRQSEFGGVLHHRSECAAVQELGSGQQGHRLPTGVRGRQARVGSAPDGDQELGYRSVDYSLFDNFKQ